MVIFSMLQDCRKARHGRCNYSGLDAETAGLPAKRMNSIECYTLRDEEIPMGERRDRTRCT